MQAVVLAGGKGVRLQPYSLVLPKPLMPVFEQPIIDIIARQLVRAGVNEIIVSVGYLHHLMKAYLNNGERYGVPLRYIEEDKPLGTAGAISLIKDLRGNFIVINGDILCDIDLKAMLQTHLTRRNDVTIGTYKITHQVDLGVLELDDQQQLVKYTEKPRMSFLVSMGVYVFSDRIISEMIPNEPLDLPDLVLRLKDRSYRVGSHEHTGLWLDMGRPTDFIRIREDESLRDRLKPLIEE